MLVPENEQNFVSACCCLFQCLNKFDAKVLVLAKWLLLTEPVTLFVPTVKWLSEHTKVYIIEPRHDKTNKMSARPAKTQISPVWSKSPLCAQWVAKDPRFLHADSEDSDQTGRMPKLIWVFAGRTLILFVLSCRGSIISYVTIWIESAWCLALSHTCMETFEMLPVILFYFFLFSWRLCCFCYVCLLFGVLVVICIWSY